MSVSIHLSTLETTGLIRLIAAQPELEYLFRHTLVQEAAYQSLVKTDRRILHRLVGEALEQVFLSPERRKDLAPLLARHFEEAGEDGKALAYYQAAGEAASAVYANQESAAHYTRAVEIARRLPAEAQAGADLKDIFLGCGHALQRVGRYDEAVALYQELEKRARDRGDRPLELAALMALAGVRSIPSPAFDPPQGKALADQARQLAVALGDREAEARMLWHMMLVRFFSGEEAGVRDYGEQALAVARELDVKELRGYILNDLAGYVYVLAGEHERGQAALLEARAIWRELDNQYMLADNLVTTALNGYVRGQHEQAMRLLREAAEITRRTGNVWGRAYCYGVWGSVYVERGQVDAARAALAEAIEAGEQSFVGAQVIARANLAALYTYMGAAPLAVEAARLSLAQAEAQVIFWRPQASGALALACLALGDVERAATVVEAGLATPQLERLYGYMNLLLLADCELRLARGENESAARRAAEIVASLRSRQLMAFVPHLLRCQGLALMELGGERLGEARAVLQEAVSIAEAIDARHACWRALAALAAAEERAGDAAAAQALRHQARPIVQGLAESTAEADLRASLLALPEARKVVEG